MSQFDCNTPKYKVLISKADIYIYISMCQSFCNHSTNLSYKKKEDIEILSLVNLLLIREQL